MIVYIPDSDNFVDKFAYLSLKLSAQFLKHQKQRGVIIILFIY